ncbi:uncharacterized protein Z520_09045 [Fonsecaea multimorphosa CBS 102226]|uniref:Trafficking protein particle complex II-specific subunit 65 IgD3 domain-containing protein n=1 Tax=Fonsecaea multimorphosa CBS 102226 TaxID=1442371 RepID=A0A0D2JX82_9EURO|nr:uncharacterized protein Z520_09045 [Fonsecaea multimorphosa CBS 102226]KIX95129.1 hypothetical protein Z520_09045 [Fonsecaea multimorphosa CBS 102226]OAL20850.1 hypothetical protein AYO22_08478 [Fonsecaea multimorphosa]
MEAELYKSALVDAIIPSDTVTDVSEILQAGAEAQNESSQLLVIEERDLLFFDERLRTLAVIRLPHCDEAVLESFLSQLSFKIDVWAIEESPGNEQNTPNAAPPRDLVYSAESIQKNEPIVLASETANRGQTLTLVWEIEILLNRPRFRVPQPAIILIPSATVTAPQRDEIDKNDDLKPFQPLEANALEPMRFLPGLRDSPPYLAASRLERVLPMTTTHRHRVHLQHVPSRRHRAVPATMSRIRYQKVNAYTTTPATVALLDVDIIPFVRVAATIEHVDLSLKNGSTETLMPGFLPMQARSGDCITFLYRLHQKLGPNRTPGFGLVNPNIDVLSIGIRLAIQLSEKCHPFLVMNWTTNVDFTPVLNPSFGPPSQSIQRPNRPTSLPVHPDSGGAASVAAVSTSLQPAVEFDSRSGVSISFTAPDIPVRVGEPFAWKVLVVNNSAKMAKIAIIPLPRIQRQATQTQMLAKRHAPKSSTASFHPSERRHTKEGEDIDIAQAIVDENVVYAMHHSYPVPPETDLLALTAELRIGPLAPDQCHESEIQMVAFEVGTLRADAMRVVDLIREVEEGAAATGVLADIRDLPDIVVVKATSERD